MDEFSSSILIILKLLIILQNICAKPLGIPEYEYCSDKNDLCLTLSRCSLLHEPIKRGFEPVMCGFNGKMPVVCCTTDATSTKVNLIENSLSARMCFRYKRMICPSVAAYIEGGDPAHAKELPFMALIGYGSQGNIQWRCGGSLISERFVLTAAHCSTSDLGPPKWIRLGDLNYAINTDDAKPEDFKITGIFNHQNYTPPAVYNDIALYQLDRDVKFNDYIRPVCLHQSSSLEGYKTAVGAGWGRMGFVGPISKQLMRVTVDLFDTRRCGRTGDKSQLPFGVRGESMVCAGSNEGGRDTCSGDSGGPLFLQPDEKTLGASTCFLYEQVGITSTGNQCGLAEYPGVYTKVYHYLKWIESIAWRSEPTDMPDWGE